MDISELNRLELYCPIVNRHRRGCVQRECKSSALPWCPVSFPNHARTAMEAYRILRGRYGEQSEVSVPSQNFLAMRFGRERTDLLSSGTFHGFAK
jgi:hypothetical protein